MEFKGHLSISFVNAKSDINRITVEFKVFRFCKFRNTFIILIESQWNLKLVGKLMKFLKFHINRITVEFKGNQSDNQNNGVCILIESQWNLK